MANPDNYVNGKVGAPQVYELRVNGAAVERSADMSDLLWKARRAVSGHDEIRACVEAVSGFGFCAGFTDATLATWERA